MAQSESTTYWNIDRIMRLIFTLGIAAVLIWLIRYLSDVLLPFFVACLIAYLLNPVVELNQRLIKAKGRTLASIMTVVEVGAVIMGVVYLFLPSVMAELDHLGAIIHKVSSGEKELPPAYVDILTLIERFADPHQLKEMLDSAHFEALLSKGSALLSESIDVIAKVLAWALTLIYVLFILIDYPQIANGFKLIVPSKYRRQALAVFGEVEKRMNAYFRGQGMVALFACVFYCIGFSIVGLPLAIPMGVLVGVLYMIPYFQYVTLVPVAAISFVYSLGGTVGFLPEFGKCVLVYVVSQCICDYIITPRIMGKEMGLNPAVILLSLSVWGSLLGIIGMIIALPATALIMAYYERYISK